MVQVQVQNISQIIYGDICLPVAVMLVVYFMEEELPSNFVAYSLYERF
jgi:hypothetical protein